MRHLVMFDIDGTLVDSAAFDGDLFARAIHDELGLRVDETWGSYRHVTDSGILEEVLAGSAVEWDGSKALALVKRRFVSMVENHISSKPGGIDAIPGAPELVRRLRSIPDVAVALATGGWRESAELKLEAVGIRYAGLPFATSSEAVSRVEIMRLAERQAALGGGFSRRTYFGDTPWDRRASFELGYEFVAVGDRVGHPRRFSDLRDHKAILDALGI